MMERDPNPEDDQVYEITTTQAALWALILSLGSLILGAVGVETMLIVVWWVFMFGVAALWIITHAVENEGKGD